MLQAAEDIARTAIERRGSRHLLVLCDLDGTLCEFDPDPGAVYLPPHRQELLNAIALRGASIGIVSGRRLADLRRRIGNLNATYLAGFHGLEIISPAGSFTHPDVVSVQTLVHDIRTAIAPGVAKLTGVFVEDKEFSITLHYREATPAAQVVAQSLLTTAARPDVEAGRLKLLPGSCAIELLPNVTWDKGAAVKWLREEAERVDRDVSLIYLGDDLTDEHAFAVLEAGDTGIGTSERVSLAEFSVDGPPGAEAFLRALCGRLS
jgi:trehalose-phosphatase